MCGFWEDKKNKGGNQRPSANISLMDVIMEALPSMSAALVALILLPLSARPSGPDIAERLFNTNLGQQGNNHLSGCSSSGN